MPTRRQGQQQSSSSPLPPPSFHRAKSADHGTHLVVTSERQPLLTPTSQRRRSGSYRKVSSPRKNPSGGGGVSTVMEGSSDNRGTAGTIQQQELPREDGKSPSKRTTARKSPPRNSLLRHLEKISSTVAQRRQQSPHSLISGSRSPTVGISVHKKQTQHNGTKSPRRKTPGRTRSSSLELSFRSPPSLVKQQEAGAATTSRESQKNHAADELCSKASSHSRRSDSSGCDKRSNYRRSSSSKGMIRGGSNQRKDDISVRSNHSGSSYHNRNSTSSRNIDTSPNQDGDGKSFIGEHHSICGWQRRDDGEMSVVAELRKTMREQINKAREDGTTVGMRAGGRRGSPTVGVPRTRSSSLGPSIRLQKVGKPAGKGKQKVSLDLFMGRAARDDQDSSAKAKNKVETASVGSGSRSGGEHGGRRGSRRNRRAGGKPYSDDEKSTGSASLASFLEMNAKASAEAKAKETNKATDIMSVKVALSISYSS